MKPLAIVCALVLAVLPSAGETLTTVAEGNGVPLEDITSPRPFDFTGTVLIVGKSLFSFSDESGGTYIFAEASTLRRIQQWDVVHIKGEMLIADEDKTRRFVSHEVSVIRHGSPIPPVNATAQEINAGKFDFKFVRIRGVFSSCVADEAAPGYFWAALRSPTVSCLLAIDADALKSRAIGELTDAEVEIVGLPMSIPGFRLSLGKCVRVYTADDISVLKPPPPNPLHAQPLSEQSDTSHRQRISGDVVAVAHDHFFVKTGIGRIIKVIPAAGEHMPMADESVEVAGFQEYVPYWLCLSEAIVKRLGESARLQEKKQSASIADLFMDPSGRKRVLTYLTGHRITLRGKVASATEDEMELTDGENSVYVMLGAVRDQMPEIPKIGSTMEATGLCWSEFHNKYESDIFPTFRRFVLYPHDASDIRTIASPPWWTPFRLAMLAIGLVALLALSATWNVSLNMKAERRGRELYEERASHAIAEKRIEERTRLAVELHDSISQTLTGIAMQLEVGATDTAQTMLSACRGELRRCLWDLRSRTFEERDMTEAIEKTLEPHANGAKITVRFNVPRERLDDSTTHTILRIVRELVVNAIRHGRATDVKVAGECHGDTISFSVADNGCGFDPAVAPGPKEGHFGLLGVRERLKEFGGELKIDSRPGQGTKATISMAIGREPAGERRDAGKVTSLV